MTTVKSMMVLTAVLLLAASAAYTQDAQPPEVASQAVQVDQVGDAMTDADKLAYSIGYEIGARLARRDMQMSPQRVSQGLVDAMSGRDPVVSRQQRLELLGADQAEPTSGSSEQTYRGPLRYDQPTPQPPQQTWQTPAGYRTSGTGQVDTQLDSQQVNTQLDSQQVDGAVPQTQKVTGQVDSFLEDQ